MADNEMRLSENPATFREVYDELMGVMRQVKAGSMTVDQGEAIAKAGFGAAKLIESDLNARVFAYKMERQLPRSSAPRAIEGNAAA